MRLSITTTRTKPLRKRWRLPTVESSTLSILYRRMILLESPLKWWARKSSNSTPPFQFPTRLKNSILTLRPNLLSCTPSLVSWVGSQHCTVDIDSSFRNSIGHLVLLKKWWFQPPRRTGPLVRRFTKGLRNWSPSMASNPTLLSSKATLTMSLRVLKTWRWGVSHLSEGHDADRAIERQGFRWEASY